jgi:nucleoside-diphosphate-sugar epimerase
MVLESEEAVNEAFNISTSKSHSVLDLAKLVWDKLNPDVPFNYKNVPGFEYDVQKRIPDVTKAYEVLGFEVKLTLDDAIDELIEYMKSKNPE